MSGTSPLGTAFTCWHLAVVGFALLRLSPVTAAAQPPAAASAATTSASKAKGPEEVQVGIYLNQVLEVDLKTNAFTADFYLWFNWRGDLDPTKSFEFTNLVGRNDLAKIAAFTDDAGTEKATVLADGRRHQEYHIQARFGSPFPLNEYPLDEQDLIIQIEDISNGVEDLVFVVDGAQSKMRPSLTVPGWVPEPLQGQVSVSRYETSFGGDGVAYSEYSALEFRSHISRPAAGALAKTVLPIFIVMFLTLTAFFISPDFIDSRVGITVTALISAVALQLSANAELPAIGYLTLLDKVYLLSYAIVLAATATVTVSHRLATHGKMAQAAGIDRAVLCGLSAVLVLGTASLLHFR